MILLLVGSVICVLLHRHGASSGCGRKRASRYGW